MNLMQADAAFADGSIWSRFDDAFVVLRMEQLNSDIAFRIANSHLL